MGKSIIQMINCLKIIDDFIKKGDQENALLVSAKLQDSLAAHLEEYGIKPKAN